MYSFRLITLLRFLWKHGISSSFIMALGSLLSLVFLCLPDKRYQDAPITLPHFSLSHITSFLKQRHDFSLGDLK